jgi:hypothetical protein
MIIDWGVADQDAVAKDLGARRIGIDDETAIDPGSRQVGRPQRHGDHSQHVHKLPLFLNRSCRFPFSGLIRKEW